MAQTTSLIFTSGNTYSLNFWIGMPKTQPDGKTAVSSFPDTLQFMLTGAGNLCDQNSATLTEIGGRTASLTGGTNCVFDLTNNPNFTDPNSGNLGIEFYLSTDSIGQPSEVNIDLDPPAVPKPASLTLLGAGLIALGMTGLSPAPQNRLI